MESKRQRILMLFFRESFLLRFGDAIPLILKNMFLFMVFLLIPPTPEPFESGVLRKLLRRGDTVVEVGARIGGSTRLISSIIGEGGGVLVLEPNPFAQRILRRNVQSLDNVRIFSCAAGESDGMLKLHLGGWFDAGASVVVTGSRSVQARVTTVDRLVAYNGIRQPDALIIDAEGAELSVLIGCAKILPSVRIVHVEVHHYAGPNLEERINEFLANYGFKLITRHEEYLNPRITKNTGCASPFVTVNIYIKKS